MGGKSRTYPISNLGDPLVVPIIGSSIPVLAVINPDRLTILETDHIMLPKCHELGAA